MSRLQYKGMNNYMKVGGCFPGKPLPYGNKKRGTAKLNIKIMSWSVLFIGKPEKVVEALNENSEKLSGYSKTEYDNALPNMVGLVQQNFGNDAQLVKIVANGHGFIENGHPKNGTLSIEISQIYGVLV